VYNGIVVVLLLNCQHSSLREDTMRTLTKAPITPSEVNLKYSKGRVLEVVLRKGYKNKGMWAS